MAQGATLLLTRPAAKSERFLALCRARGFVGGAVISPVLDIVPRDPGVDLAGFATLLFTSASAADAVAGRPDLGGQRAFAVGDATAAAVRRLGLDCASAAGSAAELVRLVADESPPGPLLHLRGVHAAGDVAGELAARGLRVAEAVVYDQQPVPLTPAALALLHDAAPVLLPLFSPRSARLVRAAAAEARAPLDVAAISVAVAEAWGGPPDARVAARPDADSLANLVVARAFG
ncbi:uroporphyrinogen-III synthase [Oceaniglobus roseus]|uniref:uroporphyrinogen-III synthase n=1 Tax=Oceaniglobus roseus TaxID=1737570 RepID=UPI000C7F47E4|nr:uroporphyrinogen-III synthase [Kandeliimicrobium roseum]